MLRWLGPPSNPSSLHVEGRVARAAVDGAREVLADSLGCLFGEVLFTSSGTESANLAILGLALANESPSRNRILMGAAEHHAVLHCCPLLERLGYSVGLIPVDSVARSDPDALRGHIGVDVLLVCLMHANNELGTINPVADLATVTREAGAYFFCDAVQTFPYCPSVGELGADLVSVSAHKLYGPTGVGALYVRAGTPLAPVVLGGGQERELRAGTENVAGIVGFAEAVKWCRDHPQVQTQKRSARDAFAATLTAQGFLPSVPVFEQSSNVLPSHFHCRFPGIDAETTLIRLDREGISASSGAACSSGSLEPSHVLMACGYSKQEAQEGLRFTFGANSTPEEALEAALKVIQVKDEILQIRSTS